MREFRGWVLLAAVPVKGALTPTRETRGAPSREGRGGPEGCDQAVRSAGRFFLQSEQRPKIAK